MEPGVRLKQNLAKNPGTRDSMLLKGKCSKSYCMAAVSGGGPGCSHAEKRAVQKRRFSLLLKIGEMGQTAWGYDETE